MRYVKGLPQLVPMLRQLIEAERLEGKTRSSKSCLRGMEVAEYTAWACEFLMFLFCSVHVHVR